MTDGMSLVCDDRVNRGKVVVPEAASKGAVRGHFKALAGSLEPIAEACESRAFIASDQGFRSRIERPSLLEWALIGTTS